jgi:MoaA/NifB/PqqE/SkfB family radical SAM enzyme
VETTHRCNLACAFCDKAEADAPIMATDRALALLDDLASAGTLSVCFDGGEPLTHPAFGDLVRRAKSHGMRVAVSTNGTLIADRLDDLAAVDVLKVSLDGPPDVHDLGRAPGSYARTLAGARAARARGLEVALRMVLAAHNTAHWPHVLETAEALGASALFQPAIGSLWDARVRRGEGSPDPAAYAQAMAGICSAKRAGRSVGNTRVCLDHLAAWPTRKPVPFCAGGRVEVAIGPDGGLYPCGRVGRLAPAPNVFELGVAEAFRRVARPTTCEDCWCTLTLAVCYLHRPDPRLALG